MAGAGKLSKFGFSKISPYFSNQATLSVAGAYNSATTVGYFSGGFESVANWELVIRPTYKIGSTLTSQGIRQGVNVLDDVGKGGRRVFWSGGEDAMNAATNYAKGNGLTTLEMTRAGRNLTNLTQGMPWEKAAPMWQRLSATYAKGATGPVHVFQNASTGVRLNSVWRTIEYPILKGKNPIIFHNIFRP